MLVSWLCSVFMSLGVWFGMWVLQSFWAFGDFGVGWFKAIWLLCLL